MSLVNFDFDTKTQELICSFECDMNEGNSELVEKTIHEKVEEISEKNEIDALAIARNVEKTVHEKLIEISELSPTDAMQIAREVEKQTNEIIRQGLSNVGEKNKAARAIVTENDNFRIAFDMDGVEYIDSVFLHICEFAKDRVEEGNFSITNTNANLMKTFKIAGLDNDYNVS